MKVKIGGKDFFEVTSEFMANEPFRKGVSHTGVDLKMNVGTNLYSPIEGVIQKVVNYGDDNIGKGIFINTEDNQTVILGHLSDIDVKKNEIISIGEKLGESGNTGNVIGNGHLHIGLKDDNGNFIDPSIIESKFQKISETMLKGNKEGFFSRMDAFTQYLQDLKTEGFFMATFDKTPFEFFVEPVIDGLKYILEFIVINNEAFFIIPAILIMFATFMIGANKYTKWIVPLWFGYFVSTLIAETTGLISWLNS
jgi:murein DD-endopeptidase MepM/ murein hydrolase activator NlpD